MKINSMKYLSDKILKHRNLLSDGNFLPNKTYDFIPMDTAERFKTNCLENENNLSLYYYKINPIEYKLNNCGFRTNDDFDLENEGNIFLGCSHSFGIGHHLENIWSYKLSKVIGDKFWNLSLPGTGVTSHFRILLYWYKTLKIKNIFHYAPMNHRYEFIENETPQSYILGDYKEEWVETFGNLVKNSLITNEQCEFNWIVYTNAIKSLANEIGVNYYLIEGELGNPKFDRNSLQARDLSHFSVGHHHKIFIDFLKIYNKHLYEEYKLIGQEVTNINELLRNYKKKII